MNSIISQRKSRCRRIRHEGVKYEVKCQASDFRPQQLHDNSNYKNMSLEQKIMVDLKTAMLAKDEKALRSLRAIKAAILLAKTSEGAGGELKEEDETKLLQKLVKQRKDSLEIFQQQNRTDLAQKEQEEIEVIEKFLPKQLSADELRSEVSAIIAEVGASSA